MPRVPAGLKRSTCESRLSVDVRQWSRGLRPGGHFSVTWSRAGTRFARLDAHVHVDAVQLALVWCPPGGSELPRASQIVRLDWTTCRLTSCHRRGDRAWFRCPKCDRRCALLYSGDSSAFGCRRCRELAYESQSQNPHIRALTKAQRLRMRLGGSSSLRDPLPARPKGMHKITYLRLCSKELLAAGRWIGHLAKRYLPSGGAGRQDNLVRLADLVPRRRPIGRFRRRPQRDAT